MNQFDPPDVSDRYKFKISKFQDGGRSHLWLSKNYHISAEFHAISTKFGTVTQFDTSARPTVENSVGEQLLAHWIGSAAWPQPTNCNKFKISKIQDGSRRHLGFLNF